MGKITRKQGTQTVTVEKIGTRYRVMIVIAPNGLAFYGEKEVGEGYPRAVVDNELKPEHAHQKRVIDGEELVVVATGGTATVEPQWFAEKPN